MAQFSLLPYTFQWLLAYMWLTWSELKFYEWIKRKFIAKFSVYLDDAWINRKQINLLIANFYGNENLKITENFSSLMQHRKHKHDEHKTVFIWSKWCNSFTYIRAVKQWVSFFCSSSFTLKSMQAWLRSFKRCIHHPSYLHSNKQNLTKERKVTSKLWKITKFRLSFQPSQIALFFS